MIKKYKYASIILVLIIFIFGGYFYFKTQNNKNNIILIQEKSYQKELQAIKPLVISKEEPIKSTKEEEVGLIKVTLSVLGSEYKTQIKEGSTLFDLMKGLEINQDNNNPFHFKYVEHPGLGSFITEINGVKGSPGKYWMYYSNDKLGEVGVSKFILKDSDIIDWKQDGK